MWYSICNIHIYTIISSYTLNLHNVIWQLYLNKVGENSLWKYLWLTQGCRTKWSKGIYGFICFCIVSPVTLRTFYFFFKEINFSDSTSVLQSILPSGYFLFLTTTRYTSWVSCICSLLLQTIKRQGLLSSITRFLLSQHRTDVNRTTAKQNINILNPNSSFLLDMVLHLT